MGNVLDYQGPTPPTGPSIYAERFLCMAAVGSAALFLLSFVQLIHPREFQTTGPLGCIAGMIGWERVVRLPDTGSAGRCVVLERWGPARIWHARAVSGIAECH